jgi:hypothetical protein
VKPLQYAALSEMGEAAAALQSGSPCDGGDDGERHSELIPGSQKLTVTVWFMGLRESFPMFFVSQAREKERNRPVLTMTMLVVQALGRTLVIPVVLLFCSCMLLGDSYSLATACRVISYTWLGLVACWELWTLVCKQWELESVRDPFWERREKLHASYDLLRTRVGTMGALESYSSHHHLLKSHIKMLTEQRLWFEKMCLQERLPSANRQVQLLAAQANLLRKRDKAGEELRGAHSIEVIAEPPDFGMLAQDTLRSERHLNTAYRSLMGFAYAILRLHPDVQNRVSELHDCDGLNERAAESTVERFGDCDVLFKKPRQEESKTSGGRRCESFGLSGEL